MSEEYDPFEEEVDYEEELQDEEGEQADQILEQDKPTSDTTEKDANDTNQYFGDIASPINGNASSDSSLSKRQLSGDDDDKVAASQPALKKTKKRSSRRHPSTEHEKWLWKSAWQYVRKFLKPYLQSEQIASTTDLERLSKKLAQKVFEKEHAKGTPEINSQNASRIKKYVALFFEKYGTYDGDTFPARSAGT